MKNRFYFWLVTLTTFIIFLITLAPTIGDLNSSRWIVNAMLAGMPGSPGNFLYLFFASFFANVVAPLIKPLAIPLTKLVNTFTSDAVFLVFEPATAVNFLSAISASVAAGLSYLLAEKFYGAACKNKDGEGLLSDGGARFFIAASVFLLFTLPGVWTASVTAGPAAFNLMLVLLSVFLLLRATASGNGRFILLWGFILGLGASGSYVLMFSVMSALIIGLNDARAKKVLFDNFRGVVMLFILGLTSYVYLVARPIAGIGLGEAPKLFSSDFWGYVFSWHVAVKSLSGHSDIAANIHTFSSYLKNNLVCLITFIFTAAVNIYFLTYLFLKNRKLMLSVVVAFLVMAIMPLWLRSSAYDALTLVRSAFLPAIALYMIVFASGMIWLFANWKQLVRAIFRKMDMDGGKLEKMKLVGGNVFFLLLLLVPSYFNWSVADHSGRYEMADLAMNRLSGTEKDAILFLANDAEYYSTLYVRKQYFNQSENILANYLWMEDTAYLTDLSKLKPAMPFTYGEKALKRLVPSRLAQTQTFRAGEMSIVYPGGTQFSRRETALLDVLRANEFKRGVFFSIAIPQNELAGLTGNLSQRGLNYYLNEQAPNTTGDSTYFWKRDPNSVAVDLRSSMALIWQGYRFRTTSMSFDSNLPAINKQLLPYASILEQLGQAMLAKGDQLAAANNFQQTKFYSSRYRESMPSFASTMAWNGSYDKAKEFMNEYFKDDTPDPMMWASLAKIALTNQDSTAATELLLESIKADPDFMLGYQKLIRLYDSMDKKVMASAFLSRWVGRHQDDQQAYKLWEEYSTTETLPPDWPE